MSTLLHVEQLILSSARRNIHHRLYPMMHDRVSAWLENLGLGIYREAFEKNAITWDVLTELNQGDLESLGVLLGHRKILLRAIAQLSSSAERIGLGDSPQCRQSRHTIPSRTRSRRTSPVDGGVL